MKKLFYLILVLGLLLSGNAYAELITLDCKSLIKDQPQNMKYMTLRIDTKKKIIDTGFGFGPGYESAIIEETNEYFKAKYLNSDSGTVFIDRYTGIVKIISTYNSDKKKSYNLDEHFRCEKAQKRF